MADEDKATIREDRLEREGADLFLEEYLPSDVLAELEERRELERHGRIAAHITIDLQDRGPLYLYVQERRQDAATALLSLAHIDPKDILGIAKAQATVQEYLKAITWVDKRMETAKRAEAIIKGDGLPDDDASDDVQDTHD